MGLELRVEDLGFTVHNLKFGAQGLVCRLRIWGLGLRVRGCRFRVQGSRFGVHGVRRKVHTVHDVRRRVEPEGFRVRGLWFKV